MENYEKATELVRQMTPHQKEQLFQELKKINEEYQIMLKDKKLMKKIF